MVRISSARIDMENGRLDNGTLRNWGETLVGGASGTNAGSSYTVDLTSGNVHYIVLDSASCALSFAVPVVANAEHSFTLIIQQDATGGRTVSWPAGVYWPNGVVPSLTAVQGAFDAFAFSTYDGGNTWFGFAAAQEMKPQPFALLYGYFAGGFVPPASPGPSMGARATVNRIDYSNDTTTAAAKGPLSATRFNLAATGTSYLGYFGGGQSQGPLYDLSSTVSRIDYINDTATAVVKGPLSFEHYSLAATGNSAYGYFGGGVSDSPATPRFSTVSRIDYSNDTANAVAKGPLSLARGNFAGVGSSSFGYFGGGSTPATPGIVSTVDRLDYSNDTATAVVKGRLSLARASITATGSSSFGYFGGGITATSPAVVHSSTVDRIDYSNDTAAAAAKGPLSLARSWVAAASSPKYGYFGGGGTPSVVSTVDRLDYSNDTAAASIKGPLSLARSELAATQHSSIN